MLESLEYHQKKNLLTEKIRNNLDHTSGKFALNKTSSNLFRPRSRDIHDTKIDVSSFNKVIHIDQKNLIAHVEGMTPYETLVDETLKWGLLPTVVPELKSITIGGAVAGCGIESSSYKYGLVHETVKEIEVLLGDGTIVECSRDNTYSDLFYGFPNTFGTLGYALTVKVKLIPVKKYVKLSHYTFKNAKHFFDELTLLCKSFRAKDEMAYIEGVIFNEDQMVITVCQFASHANTVSNYTFRNIYYRSLLEKKEDFLTTKDYIWRWDTDWFWCSKVFFMQNPIIRLLLGKFLLHSRKYAKIMHWFKRHPALSEFISSFGGKKESVIQDIAIPIDQAIEFYKFFQKEIGIKPIWICPTKAYSSENHFDFCPMDDNTLYVDFGFWDQIPAKDEDGYYNKKIEKVAKELKGFKSLYSTNYYTEDEFWQLYDQNKYTSLKNKYDPNLRLRDLYTKCSTQR